jgi:hypothetical protein
MCPACLATLSMIVAGVISTGGATALAVNTLLRGKNTKESSELAQIPGGEESESPEAKEKQS